MEKILCYLLVIHTVVCTTRYIKNIDKVQSLFASRKARSIIFPTKSNLLLTPSFAKAILDGYPRGLVYSIEFDLYSPLPDTVDGWKPTILINKLKQNNHPLIKRDANVKNTSEYSTRNESFLTNHEKLQHFIVNSRQIKSPDSYAQQEMHQNLRERRQLLDQFHLIGDIFKFNMTACVNRAVCEMTKSRTSSDGLLMEDIVRLVLTIPLELRNSLDPDLDWDFENTNCFNEYHQYCPYDVSAIINSFVRK